MNTFSNYTLFKIDKCSSCTPGEPLCTKRREEVCSPDLACEQELLPSCIMEEFTEHKMECTTEMQVVPGNCSRTVCRTDMVPDLKEWFLII